MVSHFKEGAYAEGVREQILGKMFVPKSEEIIGEQIKLNGELHGQYHDHIPLE
jgi:hypothetical protein